MEGRTALSWLSHATHSAPPQADLDRLDYERSVALLGTAPGGAGAEPPPYLENPLDTYATFADQDAQIQAELTDGGEEVEPAELEKRAADEWAAVADRHSLLSTLRAAVEHATGVRIMDKHGDVLACGVDGEMQEHAEDGRHRFVVYRCHRRDRCPECSVGYGEQRGEELVSLLDAVRSMTPRQKGYASGFALEVTVPEQVSGLIGAAMDAGQFAEARRLTRKVVKITRAVLWDAVKRRGLERGDVGAALNLHAFHSRTPMRRGWHWHVHATIPNATRRGAHLRRLGQLPNVPRSRAPKRFRVEARGPFKPEASVPAEHRGEVKIKNGRRLREDRRQVAWLSVLRLRLRELVLREFSKEVDLSELGAVNLHWHYFAGTAKGAASFRKRAMYVNRSPWHDAAKIAAAHPERVYSDSGLRDLAVFANRVQDVQTAIKTRRYLGWLSPGQRGRYGLEREAGEKSPWRPLPGGYRRIIRADAMGLWLRAYDGAGERAEFVPGSLVSWAAAAPPRAWSSPGQRQVKAERVARELAAAAAERRAAGEPRTAMGLFGQMPA